MNSGLNENNAFTSLQSVITTLFGASSQHCMVRLYISKIWEGYTLLKQPVF